MENKKNLIIISAILIVALLIIGIVVMTQDDSGSDISNDDEQTNEQRIDPFKDAPVPFANEEELDQLRDLWPDAFDQKKVDREEVKKEWQEFASVYPDNVYIPSRFLPEKTAEQKLKQQEKMNQITSIESRLASTRAKQRKASEAEPGSKELAIDPGADGVTPEEQSLYFEEKLKELESRKQIIKYAMDQNKLDPDQLPTAEADLAAIENEIKNIKKVQAEIPQS